MTAPLLTVTFWLARKRSLMLGIALYLSGRLVAFSDPPPGFDPNSSWPISPWPIPSIPGASKGETIACNWIGPYVTASKVFGETTVTWFSNDGHNKRQSAVSSIQPGFVIILGHQTMPDWLVNWVHRFEPRLATALQNREVVRGVNEDWQIALPNKSGPSGYLTSTHDSRVMVHEFHPKQGLIALDIYIHGKRVNSVGPFLQYLAHDVEINEDGGAGLLVWKDESRTNTQIVALNTNGFVRFRVDCREGHSLIVAPNGAGTLLRSNKGGVVQNSFMWFTEQGEQRSMDIGPNPWCVGWIPGSRKSFFVTSVGDARRYQLIDWDTGKRVWDIPWLDNVGPLSICLTPKLIIFAVLEHRNAEPDWKRAFYAISVQDGARLATWRAQVWQPFIDTSHDAFLWLDERLFYITSAEVCELRLEDIVSKTDGWH